MDLYLMRHGIAIDRDDPACPPDDERYLTPEGIEKTAEVAKGLVALGIECGAFYSSPLVRAMQTAEITAEAFDFPKQKIKKTPALLSDAVPAELFKLFSSAKVEAAICFGHAPNLDEVIGYALGLKRPVTSLKKAGVAWLHVESFAPPRAELVSLFMPKALRLMKTKRG